MFVGVVYRELSLCATVSVLAGAVFVSQLSEWLELIELQREVLRQLEPVESDA